MLNNFINMKNWGIIRYLSLQSKNVPQFVSGRDVYIHVSLIFCLQKDVFKQKMDIDSLFFTFA